MVTFKNTQGWKKVAKYVKAGSSGAQWITASKCTNRWHGLQRKLKVAADAGEAKLKRGQHYKVEMKISF